MEKEPYGEVTISSPNKSAMASLIVGPFLDMNIPIWIKPGLGDKFTIAYPITRVMDAQKILQQIENIKTRKRNEETPDRVCGMRNGLTLGPEASRVDEEA